MPVFYIVSIIAFHDHINWCSLINSVKMILIFHYVAAALLRHCQSCNLAQSFVLSEIITRIELLLLKQFVSKDEITFQESERFKDNRDKIRIKNNYLGCYERAFFHVSILSRGKLSLLSDLLFNQGLKNN